MIGLFFVSLANAQNPLAMEEIAALSTTLTELGCFASPDCSKLFANDNASFRCDVPNATVCSNRRLTELTLTNVRLTGTIPSSLSSLTNLVVLELEFNLLTGTIPSDAIRRLTKLERFDVSNNHLTGAVTFTQVTNPMLTVDCYLQYEEPQDGPGNCLDIDNSPACKPRGNCVCDPIMNQECETTTTTLTTSTTTTTTTKSTKTTTVPTNPTTTITNTAVAQLPTTTATTKSTKLTETATKTMTFDAMSTTIITGPPLDTTRRPTTVYATTDSVTSTTTSPPMKIEAQHDVAPLIGGIVGGVVALLLVGGLVVFLVQRGTARARDGDASAQTQTASSASVRDEYGQLPATLDEQNYGESTLAEKLDRSSSNAVERTYGKTTLANV